MRSGCTPQRPPHQNISRVILADRFNLQRFLDAQRGTYAEALSEIQRGAKRGHWMWFIFPQIAGLGRSQTAQRFAIDLLEEARAYLDHPLLGARLRECVEALQDLPDGSAAEVFGQVDAMKLRSSLTVFAQAGGGLIFDAAVTRWFGSKDQQTLMLIDTN